MKKQFGTVASIKYGTNRIVSSTNCHWLKIETGALFKFREFDVFLDVASVSQFKYIKKFTVKNRNTIIVENNIFPDVFEGDVLEITYKEYELDNIQLITSSGVNYKVGELVYIDGGTLVPDNHSIITLKVLSITDQGGISTWEVVNSGRYLSPPKDKECGSSSSELGEGAKFYIHFKEIDKRGWIDRTIASIKYLSNQSIITLNNLLPDGITDGEFSVEKWEIKTKDKFSYGNSDICGKQYEVSIDTLPYFNLHKLVKGDVDPSIIINNNFIKLSEQIKLLENKIKLLSNE
ncbi:MAG: hypothetical protein EKK57_10165 [Proteobacteria bacterium]|nr:MAG: hypothetical protein EKK57_10165 [Pseudomonadota bacterium]